MNRVNGIRILGGLVAVAVVIVVVWLIFRKKRREGYTPKRRSQMKPLRPLLKDNWNPKIFIENNTDQGIQLMSGSKNKRCTDRYCEDVFDCQRGTYNTVMLKPGKYNLTDFDTNDMENNDVAKVTYGNMLCLPRGTHVTFYHNDGNTIYPMKNSCGTRNIDQYYSADTGNLWKPTDKWTTYIGRMVFT